VEHARHDGLADERPHRTEVARGGQVDGRAQQRAPDHRVPLDQAGQLVRVEPLEPRPQRDVGVVLLLRLERDQVLDHVDRGPPLAAEQELPLEQRPVQCSGVQAATAPASSANTST
jgi:hypothetical protein